MPDLRILTCAFTCCPAAKPGFSGGEDILGWNLVKQIARFHEVWTLTNSEDQASLEQVLAEESIDNIHFVYVGLPRWLHPLLRFQGGHQFYYYLWQWKAYFVARRLCKTLNPALFHHITYANDWMASFIGALLPIPYVRGPGGGAHRTPKGFGREYPLGGRIWEKVRTVAQWLFRHDPFFVRGQDRARALLICNRESAAEIRDRWSDKVHLFPVSGISSSDLALGDASPPGDGHFRVLSAGSLLRVKGFGLAIKAFKEFVDQHPNAEFSIVGNGPEENRLQSLIRSSKLDSKVHIVPAMPRDELLLKMSSSDVFLFPSLRDGGGTVAIEGMSVGKPVVCLDTGGPGTHITDDCGVKVQPLSPQYAVHELALALERLYLDEKLRLSMGRAARARAEELYHWDKLGERLMEVYRQALAPEAAKSP